VTGCIRGNNKMMLFEIISEGQVSQSVNITQFIFKSRKVWKVEFENGNEAVLYKCGNEWMQRIEDNLNTSLVMTIGKHIDGSVAGSVCLRY
jgi:predicted hydrocarbon binding protein